MQAPDGLLIKSHGTTYCRVVVCSAFCRPAGAAGDGRLQVCQGGEFFGIFLKMFAGLIVHVFIAIFTLPYMFALVYGMAHSERRGPAAVLNLEGKLIYSTGLLIWVVVGCFLCLLVYGGFMKPKIKLR
jgi:hypothetical protein